jgi:hypothetical protein
MQNTSNEDFRALLPSKNQGGWRRVSAASRNNLIYVRDMYVRLRITRQAQNLTTHDDKNCVDLDRWMHQNLKIKLFLILYPSDTPALSTVTHHQSPQWRPLWT